QSLISRTRLPSLAEITSATGLSEFSSEYTPSSGRPKCEVTITLAPALSACSIVAMDAVMRASEVTLPFCTGTLRSARIRTRLPLRSRSVILITDMIFFLLGYVLNQAHQIAGIAVFVVVPGHDLDESRVERNAGIGIKHRWTGFAAKIGGNYLVVGKAKDTFKRPAFGCGFHGGNNLLVSRFVIEFAGQVDYGHIGNRYAERHAS